jgi:UMF1 family MFS transporter
MIHYNLPVINSSDEPIKNMNTSNHKRAINAWAMYDWANSSFATTIMAAVLPVYYANVAAATLPENMRSALWAYTTTISLLLVAILGPILGAMADYSGAKKRFLTFFVVLGTVSTALLYFVGRGDYLLASFFYIFAALGFSGSIVFYDSLLPHVANPDEIDQVSSRGYAMGYLGGGLLLAINLAMIQLTSGDTQLLMTKLSFVSVAVWWFLFTIPLWRWVPEPPRRRLMGEKSGAPIVSSLNRLGHTFASIRKYRQLFKFLIAFWLYNNGIGTIIYMASIYGKELGFSDITVIGTLLMVQFVAIPFAFLFGWLAKRIGTKRSIFLSLGVYTLIAVLGYFLTQEWQFWLLGALVATVQGGSQALSRSLFGRMLPKSQSAEFYSFFGISEKIAGAAGPLVFGLATQFLGGGRMGIISLIIFFILGSLVLTGVNVNEGIQVAEAEEALAQ